MFAGRDVSGVGEARSGSAKNTNTGVTSVSAASAPVL